MPAYNQLRILVSLEVFLAQSPALSNLARWANVELSFEENDSLNGLIMTISSDDEESLVLFVDKFEAPLRNGYRNPRNG